jgi:hypothetical protein
MQNYKLDCREVIDGGAVAAALYQLNAMLTSCTLLQLFL